MTPLDPQLEPLTSKVLAGESLSAEDGATLYASRDIFTIGRLADHVRRARHGKTAWYIANRHINYTNVCVLRCKFCGFCRKPNEQAGDAYVLTADEVVEQAVQGYAGGATEVHIVGGLHPTLPFEYYRECLSRIRAACPRMAIKAFTAVEIVHFSRISRPRRSIEDVLRELRDCGLDCLPGGGAEIFDDRVQSEAFPYKVGEHDWFAVHRAAHDLGIPTNATMLYGHIETPAQRIAHMVKLREHQDESLQRGRGAFNCMVPLSFVPGPNTDWADLVGPSGLDDLKTLAICRLMLDNFPHIKAFWPIQTIKLAQAGLSWGVDDFDGTVVWYDITKKEGQGTHQQLDMQQLRTLICETGYEPAERDCFYNRVVREGAEWRTTPPPPPSPVVAASGSGSSP
jgi:aminodeoxyfutalosine synthase